MDQYIEGGPIVPVLSLTEQEWLTRNQSVQGGPVIPVYVTNTPTTGGTGNFSLPDLTSFYSTYYRAATGPTALDQGQLDFTPWFEPSANYMYYVPLFLDKENQTLIDIAFETLRITGGATGKIRIGLYATDDALTPFAKVADYGEISLDPLGVKVITANTALTDKIYLIGFVADHQFGVTVSVGGLLRGFPSADASFPQNSISNLRKSFTYAALPATGPSPWVATNSTDAYGFNCPFFVRISG